MRVIKTVSAMQTLALRWKRTGGRVGFVPTMGYLHDGHMSLVRRARQLVGPKGFVVVSIYVNPTQFAPNEDLAKYPRDFKRDEKLCRAAGADVVFYPDNTQMYPRRPDLPYSTFVTEEYLSQGMEGVTRPTHFRGVATVVAKLFNIVLPDAAVFGAKDFQQAALIRKMVSDLNFPVKVVVAPTRRESDGLAMSSRNKYLSPEERPQALALSQAIQEARASVARTGVAAGILRRQLKRSIEKRPAAHVDYIEFFNPETLRPVQRVTRDAHMALAVFMGKTRLIDNGPLS